MLIVVTFVGMAVQVYSLSYMKGEERIAWYYAVLSLFTAAMLTLVLAGDFLLFYMSWEVMGLCSYLLIGFWNTNDEARRASIKAFLTTRVGDVGFAIGLAIMWVTAGTFDMPTIMAAAPTWAPGVATAIALLFFFGAMGKSAQFPLHIWLPDAMAGPTPASALIHAATMVAAGVFLVARALPIFEVSGVALEVVLVIGAITTLMAATMGAVVHDIKKVLAYSTISQLGYMFLGLGTGSLAAGMFHLFTHAFFKSLLFLGAGSVIHALHTQDMREMGGVSKQMKVTTAVFTVGTLALAGIFPFAGFFSKDLILDHLWREQHYVIFAVALATAFLTAFYMARLWFRVFTGIPRLKGSHAHESDYKMLSPMIFLAALVVLAGPTIVMFGEFVGSETEWPQLAMALTSSVVALGGIGLGWVLFGNGRDPEAKKARESRIYMIITNKYFLDVIADNIAAGYNLLSKQVNWFDKKVINGVVNGVGVACRWSGSKLRLLQAGRVQVYQRMVIAAVIVLVVVAVYVGGV
jgi:NADH-quinone oxidoreductase subunit L